MTPPPLASDEALVRRALEVAAEATATGDVPIGAVVVNAAGVGMQSVDRGTRKRHVTDPGTSGR